MRGTEGMRVREEEGELGIADWLRKMEEREGEGFEREEREKRNRGRRRKRGEEDARVHGDAADGEL